jgi:cytochrome c-type biogenesis protein CcmH
VRERLVQGDSDQDVIEYVVSRYGEFVLLKPRFSMQTVLLWGAPVAIFLIGAAVMLVNGRGRDKSVAKAGGGGLTDDEQAELAKLLKDRDREV